MAKIWNDRKISVMLLIDLFSLNVLFPQYRSRANTLGKRFFQISSYSRAYLCILNFWKDNRSSSPGTYIGKTKHTSVKLPECTFRFSYFSVLFSVICPCSSSSLFSASIKYSWESLSKTLFTVSPFSASMSSIFLQNK